MLEHMLIRADASSSMGTGHVMRCLALAQAAQNMGMAVRIISRVAVPWVRERLWMAGVPFSEIVDPVPEWENLKELLKQLGDGVQKSWIILDGYHFGLDCQKAVREAGYKLLLVDDYAHLSEYSCDILLNQNIGTEELIYKGDIGRKLLGPEYASLRPEFSVARKKAKARRFLEKIWNILLTLGGGDFSEHLARIALDFSLPEMEGCTLHVIAGSMPPKRIRELLRGCPARLEILSRIDDMPALLLGTDLCVTAGGSICWELCCLGVPFLTLEVAENQHDVVHELQRRSIACIYTQDAFVSLMHDSAARRQYTEAGLALVDGMGAGRVLHMLGGI